jgi:tetratricopeptide (TPR) repeat protein
MGDTPGRNSVSGIVIGPDRTPAGRGILIRIFNGKSELSAQTDQDGRFLIMGVGNGTFSVTVDAGDDLEPESQFLELVLTRGTTQNLTLDIKLRRKPNAQKKPGVIDAELASVPKKAQQYHRNAVAKAANGDHKGAVEELLRAVAEYPDFTMAHAELGVQYQKLNDTEKAEEHLRIALKIKPGAYESLANLGVVLAKSKKYDEAESALREALKIKDDSAVLHFYLGRSLAAQKKSSEAEAAFRTALRIGGKQMIEVHRALANMYLQSGENEKALAELEAYLAANPKAADEKKLRETVDQIKGLISGAKQKP